jgi:LuxR family maltose regulon positive regulatory protein
MITKTKAHYLSANFNAFTANIRLYNGDEDTANRWLSQTEVEDTLLFYRMYQYFTTARALMVTGRLPEAEALLERIIAVLPRYRRPADCIEALTLRSVCLWHMKRESAAIQACTAAIIKATELQLVMPIIKEGSDILPILQKILTRLKYGYDTDILDKGFINILFHAARAMSEHRGIMVKKNRNKPIKLSPRQLEILECLDQNYSYKEICAKLGIKFTTVNDHINKIYEKLEVSNAREALIKAKELGIGYVLSAKRTGA